MICLHMYVYTYLYVLACVYMCTYVCVFVSVYVCAGVSVFQHCWPASLSGDFWATAIRWLTLTKVTRLDSVCQAQDAD